MLWNLHPLPLLLAHGCVVGLVGWRGDPNTEGMRKQAVACVVWCWPVCFLLRAASSHVPIVIANAVACSRTGSDGSRRSLFCYKPFVLTCLSAFGPCYDDWVCRVVSQLSWVSNHYINYIFTLWDLYWFLAGKPLQTQWPHALQNCRKPSRKNVFRLGWKKQLRHWILFSWKLSVLNLSSLFSVLSVLKAANLRNVSKAWAQAWGWFSCCDDYFCTYPWTLLSIIWSLFSLRPPVWVLYKSGRFHPFAPFLTAMRFVVVHVSKHLVFHHFIVCFFYSFMMMANVNSQ